MCLSLGFVFFSVSIVLVSVGVLGVGSSCFEDGISVEFESDSNLSCSWWVIS